jgi:prepilin-type N-terminal cleavage/methylation domain-containing protein
MMRRFRKPAARRCGLTLLELLIVLTILVALSTLIVPTMGYLGRRSQRLAARENLYRLQNLVVNRYWTDMGDLPRPALDLDGSVLEPARVDHPQLRYLFVNPDRAADPDDPFIFEKSPNLLSGRAWQGPYVSHSGARYTVNAALGFSDLYGLDGDPAVLDAWGRPIVLQLPTEIPVGLNAGDDDLQILRIQRLHTRLVSAGANGRIDTPVDQLMPLAVDRGDDVVVFLFRHDEDGDGFLTLEDE